MSESTTVKVHVDTWVDHGAQYKSHGGGAKLRIRGDGSGQGHNSLMFARTPFDRGDTIKSATLRVYRHNDWGAGMTLRVRRVTEKWKENHANWHNQPAADNASEVVFNAPAGNDKDEFAIDVTPLYIDASGGDPYHGLKIVADEDDKRSLYSSESPVSGVNPKIDFEWTHAPYPPSNLHPGGGHIVSSASPTLGWRFSDNAGKSTTQGSSQVQISASEDFTGALLYDSGKVANEKWIWNLAGRYALNAGDTVYWRVKVWDEDDLASGWSDTVHFTRIDKFDLEITNPQASPLNYVDDLTPPISFTVTGGTLARVKMKVSEVKADGSLRTWYEFKEQAVDPAFNSITIPRKFHLVSGKTFRVQLYAWDDLDRTSTPGDRARVYAQRDFTYQRSGVPAPVDTLTADPAYGDLFAEGQPKIKLTWTRVTEPDWFCLVVDDVEVFPRIEPADVMTDTPGEYSIDYWRGTNGVSSKYEVEAVVTDPVIGSRQHSSGNPTDTATPDVRGKWLVDEDDSLAVQIIGGDQPTFDIGESGTTNFPVGGRIPIRTTDSVRGHEGSASGLLRNTAIKDQFLELKGRMKPLRYMQQRFNIPVRLAEVSVAPHSTTSEMEGYDVSLNMFQLDEFFDVVGT